jgi:putative endonuclease
MFYAYVIKSLKADFVYKGHCEDLEKRLQQHNVGMTESIRPYIPFELIYFEKYDTREELLPEEDF